MKALRVAFRLVLLIGFGIAILGSPTTAQTTSPKEAQPPAPGSRKLTGDDARQADELDKAIGVKSLDAARLRVAFTGLERAGAEKSVRPALAASGELRQFGFIHLATHGVIDEDVPARSAVILTQTGLPDPLQQALSRQPVFDGRLSVREIQRGWDLKAELVSTHVGQAFQPDSEALSGWKA